jgi:hypothetical protein
MKGNTMKTVRILSVAVLTALAGAAQADNGNYPGDFPAPSADRAKVKADLREALANGPLWTNDTYPKEQPVAAVKSRAQVVAETKEAQRLGVLQQVGMEYRRASAEQERLIAEAGQRAVDSATMAAK